MSPVKGFWVITPANVRISTYELAAEIFARTITGVAFDIIFINGHALSVVDVGLCDVTKGAAEGMETLRDVKGKVWMDGMCFEPAQAFHRLVARPPQCAVTLRFGK